LPENGRSGNRTDVIIEAAKEVGPSLFFALLVISVGFLAVFTLQGQAGRLFKPLAYTKTFAMLFASFLAITLTPVLMTIFLRGKIQPEDKNPIIVFLGKIYRPRVAFALKYPKAVIAAALILMALTVYPIMKLGTEFMPPLYEGTLFYMPVTVPGASVSEVASLLQMQDSILKKIPEVAQVFGKAGRAETATDPAPLEMFETVINMKDESQWRRQKTWYSSWAPEWLKTILRHVSPDNISPEQIKDEMNDALSIPGVANSFTMPIKARIDMLATGIRTPVGIKILGPDLEEIEKIGLALEHHLKDIPGTRSVYAERVTTGYFLDIAIKRDEAARYGLTVDDVGEVIQTAIGGMNLTVTVEGRARYPVNIRYPRYLRSDVEQLKRILVPVMMTNRAVAAPAAPGEMAKAQQITQIPLGTVADFKIVKGPTAIKSEEGLLTAYVFIDFSGRDLGGYVEEAKQKASTLKIPEGYRLSWSGEYENLTKTHERLKMVIPLTLFIIFLILYMNTRSTVKTMIVLLAVPFSLVGSFWFLYLLNYNMSIAVWVGIIALAGLDAETGVIMLLYLDLSHDQWKKEGRMNNMSDLKDAIMHGAVKRVRPKLMTVGVILAGLIPIMFSDGAGSDVMKRIAAPMIGGVITSEILELTVYPAIYLIWKRRELSKD
jgi:Cu(I)/Ag(I) efflux system membrane protein CusA/SilA